MLRVFLRLNIKIKNIFYNNKNSIFKHPHRNFSKSDESWIHILPSKRTQILETILAGIKEIKVNFFNDPIHVEILSKNAQYLGKRNKLKERINLNATNEKKRQNISFKRNTCNKNKYKCPECPYRGRDNDNIKSHLKQHNNISGSKIKCNSCSFFCTINNMAKHNNVHSQDYE